MGVRSHYCWLLIIVAAVAWSGSASAQVPANDAVAELTQAVNHLAAVVETLRDESVHKGEFEDLQNRVAVLEDKLEINLKMLTDQSARQRQILNQISRSDGNGNYAINLLGNMQQPEFRQEFEDAVHKSIRQRGTLRIKNNMAFSQNMLINNKKQIYVPPYGTIDVDVPVGTLTTELLGHEAPKNWTITAPNYYHEIVINPRPVRHVIVEPPIIIGPPVIYGPIVMYP